MQFDFDPAQVSYEQLVEMFFSFHDATFAPISGQYRSVIFVADAEQERIARSVLRAGAGGLRADHQGADRPLAGDGFHLAEDYHQKYALQMDSLLYKELKAIYPDLWRPGRLDGGHAHQRLSRRVRHRRATAGRAPGLGPVGTGARASAGGFAGSRLSGAGGRVGGEMIEPGGYIRDILKQSTGDAGSLAGVSAHGWVKTRRDGKGVHFIQLNDGSCFEDLQVVVEAGTPAADVIADVTTGACIRADGDLVASPGSGQAVELKARAIHVFGTADSATYPLQKKGHTMEFLRDIAHLRSRSNTFGAVFRVRNALSFAIHRFFHERGFLYVHTPIITASDAEGAGAMFRVSTLDMMNLPRTPEGAIDYAQDFFGKSAHLTVSGQLEAEIFALAFSNVYTFGPTFRAENSNTPRHLSEFWMVEPEMAFCDLDGDRKLAEEFLKYIIAYVLDNCASDLEFFNKRIDDSVLATLAHVAESDFEHVTYTEAVRLLKKAADGGRDWEFPCEWGSDLQSEHERYLTEEVFKKPVIVTDYPKEIKAFYMRLNDDGTTVRAMDVLAPRIGEIIGGSQREERHDVLLDRIRLQGLSEEDYWWYLELRKFGSAPHAGFGLGLERMLMYVTGMKNIRDVIPFPRVPGSAAF